MTRNGTPAAARTLWVVDPSLQRAEDQGVEEILDGWRGDSRLFRPALVPGDGPDPGTGYAADGLVLMGSAASVHDERPWMQRLASWLSPILAGEVDLPVLGICFGHQLIAHVAGGTVDYLEPSGGKRVGVEISRLGGGRLIPGEQSLRVVVSHREEVRSVPRHYRVVARRDPVRVDGLEHESLPIFSFQFHPEAGEQFARHAGIAVELLDSALRDDSRRVIDAFLRRVAT